MFSKRDKGDYYETLAWQFLKRQGCQLQTRNWHCRYGEIDLIVLQDATLIFIEVRYRKNNLFGGALASLNPVKMAKLERSAQLYLQRFGWQGPCRFDAVLIDGDSSPIWLKNIME